MATRSSLLLILVAVAVALMAAELLLRLISPQAIGLAPSMYAADSVLVHRLRPGFRGALRSGEYSTHVSINAHGYRGAPWPTGSPLRVLVLGDSFTFGYGVEAGDAYPAVLQRLLSARGCTAAVYNAGVPGYGTLQERAVAVELLPRVSPQVVILGFTVGSDVGDNLEHAVRPGSGYEVRDGFLVQKGTPRGTPLPLKAWLQQRSHLYVLLQKARVRAAVRRSSHAPPRRACEHFLSRAPCGDMATAWELTAEALQIISEECVRAGAHLIVVLIPHPTQVDDGLWRRELVSLGDDEETLDRFRVQRRIGAICTQIGAVSVDPISTFRGYSSGDLYYRLDRHLTVAGHALIGTALLPSVAQSLNCSMHGTVDIRGVHAANLDE